jgi:hypothetical protein
MTKVTIRGIEFELPYRGRMGCQIERTLVNIIESEGIALYRAMGLQGRAKSYAGRYRNAFIRFAEQNPDLLEAGPWGPKGGWGYRLKGRES